MYQLYYYPNNASLAPHMVLKHLGLDYELILVNKNSNQQKSPEYLALNPTGRIPTLVDDGQAIFESAAICIHLCEQHGNNRLIPTEPAIDRARFFQWLTYLNNTLQAALMAYYYPHRYTMIADSIPDVRQSQELQIAQILGVIDTQLAKHDYLLGDDISACDFFLFMLCEWSLPIEQSPMTFTNLAPYLTRLAAHPTIKSVCQTEEMDLTPFTG